ncbi:MAG: endonuclease/exonuclease/phosphatase family protein [Bdellovibrionia bacterium]
MKNLLLKLLTAFVFFTLLSGCSIKMLPDKWDLPPKAEDEISIMHFNIENLFDTEDDPDREDHAYLPAQLKKTPEHAKLCASQTGYRYKECMEMDYSESLIKKKMSNLAKIILGVDNKGPDVLVLIEIENEKILKRFNEEFLKDANYQTAVLLEGWDRRGVDVALLSRLPLAGKATLHKPEVKDETGTLDTEATKTRGILDVPLALPNKETLHVIGAHLPSQANPTKEREQILKQIVNIIKNKGENAMVVAGGDFNITAEEEDSNKLFKKIATPIVDVSHFVGCKKCPGSHNYRKRWSFLDVQLYSPALKSEGKGSYRYLTETIDIIRYDDLHIERGKYPMRWSWEKKEGVSDHFPIYVRLKKRPTATEPSIK